MNYLNEALKLVGENTPVRISSDILKMLGSDRTVKVPKDIDTQTLFPSITDDFNIDSIVTMLDYKNQSFISSCLKLIMQAWENNTLFEVSQNGVKVPICSEIKNKGYEICAKLIAYNKFDVFRMGLIVGLVNPQEKFSFLCGFSFPFQLLNDDKWQSSDTCMYLLEGNSKFFNEQVFNGLVVNFNKQNKKVLNDWSSLITMRDLLPDLFEVKSNTPKLTSNEQLKATFETLEKYKNNPFNVLNLLASWNNKKQVGDNDFVISSDELELHFDIDSLEFNKNEYDKVISIAFIITPKIDSLCDFFLSENSGNNAIHSEVDKSAFNDKHFMLLLKSNLSVPPRHLEFQVHHFYDGLSLRINNFEKLLLEFVADLSNQSKKDTLFIEMLKRSDLYLIHQFMEKSELTSVSPRWKKIADVMTQYLSYKKLIVQGLNDDGISIGSMVKRVYNSHHPKGLNSYSAPFQSIVVRHNGVIVPIESIKRSLLVSEYSWFNMQCSLQYGVLESESDFDTKIVVIIDIAKPTEELKEQLMLISALQFGLSLRTHCIQSGELN